MNFERFLDELEEMDQGELNGLLDYHEEMIKGIKEEGETVGEYLELASKYGYCEDHLILRHRNISGLDFSCRDLRGVIFDNCCLRFSSFRNTDISLAEIINCDFRNVNLNGVKLDNIKISGSSLAYTDLNMIKETSKKQATIEQITKNNFTK